MTVESVEAIDNVKGKGERDVTDLTLLPGSHSFPFAFQLPQQPIPSPFETRFGHVRYTATATVSLRRSLGNKVYNTVVVFNMAGPTVDLNQMAGVELGVQRTFEHRDFLGLTGRQTEVTIGLPKQGYVPGERIYVTGHVDNSSGQKQTRTFEARLVERITYIRSYGTYFQKANLAIASSRVKLRKGEKTDFSIGPLLIPPVPSTGLPGCNLIDIEYYVKVRDCKASHTVKHPVTVGTVPLREPSLHSGGEPPHDGQTKQATGQASPSRHFAATAAPVQDYMMTFEEGMKFEVVDDIVQGRSAPLYNYFHMPDKPPDTSAVKV
ncbi:arrestin domain-containing protein 1-like [Patiria miniata]|uniref:Arrestin C-terminal-like domain-containing protein n=1 Tax=Patiria miniata TaxID=46514 RepID=A0A914BAT7_PATMI|nr:arrestin domain-containing protein 1-like [Patiria miniata]